jgi:hypothetical protein
MAEHAKNNENHEALLEARAYWFNRLIFVPAFNGQSQRHCLARFMTVEFREKDRSFCGQ